MHSRSLFLRPLGGVALGLLCFTFGCGGGVGAAAKTRPSSGVSLSLSPATVTLQPGESKSFTAQVSGSQNTALDWTATGGTVSGSGTAGTYTAGSNAGAYAVMVALPSGAGGATVSAKASITIQAATAATVTVSPASATLTPGQTQQFSATVSGGGDSTVSWTATGGSISSAGLFTAGNSAGSYTVTAASTADGSAKGMAAVTITAASSGSGGGAGSGQLFTSPSAAWLYNPPTGSGTDISSTTSQLGFSLNTASGGFSYPVQYTDGSHGCTTFTDTLEYNYSDKICVPNPASGYDPTTGGWGANDGHLIVVNTANRTYYDFWKLYTDGNGHPTSTNVGKIASGDLNTSNGTPGTTAANITGLAGDILPGELDCADCIHHALNVIVPASMDSNQLGHQGPVTVGDGQVSGAIFREGAKIRLDPSVDVNSLPVSTAVKAIMTALQKYGGLITDQTGASAICVYSALDSQPDMTGQNLIVQHLLIYY
ncbi:MAG: hypothetical protein ACRD2E_00195 [Terriglobales bacterium]